MSSYSMDEDEEAEPLVIMKDTPLRQLLDSNKHSSSGQGKKGGPVLHRLQYAELSQIGKPASLSENRSQNCLSFIVWPYICSKTSLKMFS